MSDEELRTRRALRWIIWPSYPIIVGGAAVFLLLGISGRPDLTILFHGLGLLVIAVAHVLTERGELRLASDILIALFFAIYTLAAGFSGGTTSPYMGGFLLVIVGAGVLRGSTTGLITAGLSIAMAVGFTALELAGRLPESPMPMTTTFNLVAWTLVLGMTAVLLHLTLGEMQRALNRALITEGALADALGDLHQTSVSKESVEAVLLGLGDAVFVLDADLVVRDVNPSAEKLLGLTKAQLVERRFPTLVDGPPESGERVLLGEEGRVHVSMSRAALRDADGRVDGEVIVAHDIRARVAAEERLRRAAIEAEGANMKKSSFLATMSHELRTPLNAIIGYAEFVQEELNDATLRSDVGRIERSGRDLLRLINDVLDLSKIEAGKLEVEVRDVDIPKLVEDVSKQVAPLVARNGNKLALKVGAGVGAASTDPTRLRQILRNLLSNAAKFTEAGQIELCVEASAEMLRFEVHDSGVGMNEQQLLRIWEPFKQAERSTTRKYGGTGLGLPITKELCGLLGGSIEVRSKIGEGTSFTAWLPVHATVLTTTGGEA